MGMQVSSLIQAGNYPVATAQEAHEKQHPLPIEKKASSEQDAPPLPGTQKPSDHELKQATAALENISLAFNRRLQFVIDQESKEIIVKVIDNETDKVIKVLPPEELQRLHSRIKETIGFLFDQKV